MKPIDSSIANVLPQAQVDAKKAPEPDAKALRAGREFEAIFLRKMLSSLDKASHVGDKKSGGGDVYSSMVVGAMADSLAASGGIGLAEVLVKGMAHGSSPEEAKANGGKHPNGLSMEGPTGLQMPENPAKNAQAVEAPKGLEAAPVKLP